MSLMDNHRNKILFALIVALSSFSIGRSLADTGVRVVAAGYYITDVSYAGRVSFKGATSDPASFDPANAKLAVGRLLLSDTSLEFSYRVSSHYEEYLSAFACAKGDGTRAKLLRHNTVLILERNGKARYLYKKVGFGTQDREILMSLFGPFLEDPVEQKSQMDPSR